MKLLKIFKRKKKKKEEYSPPAPDYYDPYSSGATKEEKIAYQKKFLK
jgi:hypothetical protein